MIEFIDKDIKVVVITVFHIFKKLEERLNVLTRDMEDIEMISISPLEKISKCLKLKKKPLDGINCRLNTTEEKINLKM